ncbi:MAG: SUMF1/EgtB/PvdO family nonheme iron enzyme [Prevotella sp.]|nr:SUMF1/EgtB/PvdO family nonheme iron enzyme [Prevotella sp.]
MQYDIFISYKRKSLPTANNLYYRLTTRGYSTFFDLEEMRRDNFNTQLLQYIENAKDVFVILEEGSLDACTKDDWKKDWFCREISFALEKKKNIIPILLGGYKMPSEDFLPGKLKDLSFKQSPEFSFSFFEAYLDKLIEKDYLLSKPNLQGKATSVFKFYSNETYQVFKEGKLVCSLEGMSDEPYYLPVPRKGDYRFKAINAITAESTVIKEHIDADEEKDVEIEWKDRKPFKPEQEWPEKTAINGDEYIVDLGVLKFNMIRVEGGDLKIGATTEQFDDAESNEHPAHLVTLPTFYIGQFPITQNIWELVMGYNKSKNQEKRRLIDIEKASISRVSSAAIGAGIGTLLGPIGATVGGTLGWLYGNGNNAFSGKTDDIGHYPVENITHDEAVEFVHRLSKMTNIKFALPTEAEWEYAARGGQKSRRFKYAGSNDINEVAWFRDNAGQVTHPVGEKRPNELGLYDMSGNVWEWTETLAHSYASDIEAEGNVYIRRGGCWWHKAKNCRVSRRYASDHTKKTSGLGLRVVIRENVEQ